MKYINAKDILPKELLKEVQKYVSGKIVYIPLNEEKRNWGESSGYRHKLQKRNQMIRNKYANGITISQLADEYFLSLDSIKKIIYSKKTNMNLEYKATLVSAIEYSNEGMAEEWINSFLLFTYNDEIKHEKLLKEDELSYIGVAKLPLRLIQMEHKIETKFDDLIESFDEKSSENPPLIVEFNKGKFYTMVQNEVFFALKKRKVNAYPVFILIKGSENYKNFMKNYGKVLLFVNEV